MDLNSSQSNKCPNCGAVMVESLDGTLTCTHCGTTLRSGQGSSATAPSSQPDTAAYKPIPREVALASGRKRQVWRPYFWGFFIWVMTIVPRALLYKNYGEDFSAKSTVYDNLFISPVGGGYWMLRALLLLVVFPTIVYLYQKKNQAI